MICPKCRYKYTRVLEGRVTSKDIHERTRECCLCAHAFKTVEILKPDRQTRRTMQKRSAVTIPAAENTAGTAPATRTETPAPPREDWRSALERKLRDGD